MTNAVPPLVLTGPILRRINTKRITLWLATREPVRLKLQLMPADGIEQRYDESALTSATQTLTAGKHLYFYLIDLALDQPLPTNRWIGYDLSLGVAEKPWQSIKQWGAELCYGGKETPGFVIRHRLDRILHGSCRKPHHASDDGLVRADQQVEKHLETPEHWPSVLMMSGDQVYVDDVAGPMLVAIHRLIAQLELPHGTLEGADISSTQLLHGSAPYYYRRAELLPDDKASGELTRVFFGGAKKPIFTSDNAHNHLVSLAEMLAMYLLVWSPTAWHGLSLEAPCTIPEGHRDKYNHEVEVIGRFVSQLHHARRVMAHLPCAMIFDDHDVTDDWNLTAAWEQTAYGNPFSKRIIGNALVAYLVCQGWGNAPEQFSNALMAQAQQAMAAPGCETHKHLIEELIRFPHWHYSWDTEPVLIVLDTRTHRWRSEKSFDKPSGLMDWEAITDLQSQLLGHNAVVMVSPAPIFGVKLIEAIQRVVTALGYPLLVDAENWMAHAGSAHALMNLFRHPRTPDNFVILSGDVHYSFVYDIELRDHVGGPDIWQITSSGVKNEFPDTLLDMFDRLNRWLYAPWSPLNWFTKRRGMRVVPRKPKHAQRGERLINASGIGWLMLDSEGRPNHMVQLCSDGRDLEFEADHSEATWE